MRIKDSFFYTFRVPIYGDVVILASKDKVKRVDKYLLDHDKDKTTETENDWAGFLNYQPPYFSIVFDHTDIDTIGHEVFHLTHRILEHRYVVFTPENHEPFSYLQGWLLDEILKRIKDERPRNRGKSSPKKTSRKAVGR